MRAQTAPLGLAAVMAVSSAVGAVPCAHSPSVTPTTTAAVCGGGDSAGPINPSVEAEHETAGTGDPLAADAAEANDLVKRGAFSEIPVKITDLQATMTSTRFIAGHIPPVPPASSTEELMMYAPDYMAVQSLPRLPKRQSVGVGLVTLPKPVKKSDTLPGAEGQPKPTR